MNEHEEGIMMTPIETLRHLQEEIDSIEKIEREKMKEVSEQIFDPLHKKKLSCVKTMESFHKQCINDMRGKHYKMKHGKYCPFMQSSMAFMILGYTDETEMVLTTHVPVLSLVVSHLLSGKHDIRYHEHLVYIPQNFYRDVASSYEAFIRFLDEYCEEISAEEFHKLFIATVSNVEEANLTIIPKKEENDDDDDDMSDAVDVIDESEDD